MAATKRNAAGLTSAVPRATLNDEELVSLYFIFIYLWTNEEFKIDNISFYYIFVSLLSVSKNKIYVK